jgi:hypothetical protein
MELQLAMGESGRRGCQTLDLPLTAVTPHEEEIHQRFADRYGHDPMDVENLVDFFFPKT